MLQNVELVVERYLDGINIRYLKSGMKYALLILDGTASLFDIWQLFSMLALS
jgi:hypothetical protein